MNVKPIKTNQPISYWQRQVRIWEGKRAQRLEAWRRATKLYKKTDPRRKKAWKNYHTATVKLKEARGKLLYAQQHKKVPKRQRAIEHARSFAGKVKEQPPNSNRGGMITVWQQRLGSWLIGTPWCGTFCANMLLFAGVKGVSSRMASVALIEDDARAGRGPFRGWTTDAGRARRGDLVVLFGRGVHVGMVHYVKGGTIYTTEGNTASGSYGSQANGGGVFNRARPRGQARGFALVRYPD